MTAVNADAYLCAILATAMIFLLSATPVWGKLETSAVRAGHVVLVEQVAMQRVEVDTERLEEGDSIYRRATINTNRAGSARMLLDDGSSLTLGANSDLVIDDFVYQPERDTGRASLRLVQGILRMLSGRMGSDSYSVSTRIAVLGVRGTAFTIDNRKPELLTIQVDEGTVIARPLQGSQSYRLTAPSFAVCTLTKCTFGDTRRAWKTHTWPGQPAIASSDALIR